MGMPELHPATLAQLCKEAGIETAFDMGSGSCAWTEGCNGITQGQLTALLRSYAQAAVEAERAECVKLLQLRSAGLLDHAETIRRQSGMSQSWELTRASASATLRCSEAIRSRSASSLMGEDK